MEEVTTIDTAAADGEEQSESFNVEKILNRRVASNGQISYLIKWEGYSNEENTWERIQDLQCWKMMEDFEASLRAKSAARRGTKRSSEIISAPSIESQQNLPSSSNTIIPSPVVVKNELLESANSSTESVATINNEESLPGYETGRKERRRSTRVIPSSAEKTEPELPLLPGTPTRCTVPAGRGRPRGQGQTKRTGIPVKSRVKKELNFTSNIPHQRKDPVGAQLALMDMAQKNISNMLTKGKEPVSVVGLMLNDKNQANHLVMFEKDYLEAIPVPYMRLGYPQLLIDFYERKLDGWGHP